MGEGVKMFVIFGEFGLDAGHRAGPSHPVDDFVDHFAAGIGGEFDGGLALIPGLDGFMHTPQGCGVGVVIAEGGLFAEIVGNNQANKGLPILYILVHNFTQ